MASEDLSMVEEPTEATADSRCDKCFLSKVIPRIPMYAPCSRNNLDPEKTYLWCSCGKSSQGPLCDEEGCTGSSFKPVKFLPKKQTFQLLCACRYTRTPPYCDGRHGIMPANPTVPPCACDHPDIRW